MMSSLARIGGLLLAFVFVVYGYWCPDEDPALKPWSNRDSWNQSLPKQGDDVIITEPVLLDTVTPSLGSVIIEPTGALVFSAKVPLAKITALNILLRGKLEIGSGSCFFSGEAEIVLTERSDDPLTTVGFNQKVLAVGKGGVLRLYGKPKLSWTKLAATVRKPIVSRDSENQILTLRDDVSSWVPGDVIVIAPTDFNASESETFTLLDCNPCDPRQIRIKGHVEYTHLGETIDRVDLSAEVGVLSRNIKFRGQMEKSCYGNNTCDKYNFDNFGAHIRVGEGFRDVKIVGVELTDVGQQSILGSYPIHFHLAGELRNMTDKPVVSSNSIWHSYARCVTIHGTNGLKVTDNVCYDIMGHAYFIEDGGEKNITFKGNLGILIKRATLIASDATHASVFFITTPLTKLINNVAVGAEDVGFLYAFPTEPIGLLVGRGLFQPDEASRTQIQEFEGNIAHSNGQYGLYFDGKFSPKREILDVGNDYDPRVDPLDPSSALVPVYFCNFTAFKNKLCHARIRGNEVHVVNSSFADSKCSVELLSSHPGAKYLTDSVIIGKIGNGNPARRENEPASVYQILQRDFEQSLVERYDMQSGHVGFCFGDAPTYLHRVYFNGFPKDPSRYSGAIAFGCEEDFLPSPVSGASEITFGFKKSKGSRFFPLKVSDYSVITDFDGSLTSHVGSALVLNKPFLTTPKCDCQGFDGLCACPHKYIRLDVGSVDAGFIVTRNDIPESYVKSVNRTVSPFLVIPDKTYILHFESVSPSQISLTAVGLDSSAAFTVGICMPSNARYRLRNSQNSTFASAKSYEELRKDKLGDRFFQDVDAGLVFINVVNPNGRTTATKLDCPDQSGGDGPCPWITLDILENTKPTDCRKTAYPKYTEKKEYAGRRRDSKSKRRFRDKF